MTGDDQQGLEGRRMGITKDNGWFIDGREHKLFVIEAVKGQLLINTPSLYINKSNIFFLSLNQINHKNYVEQRNDRTFSRHATSGERPHKMPKLYEVERLLIYANKEWMRRL